MNRVLPPNEAMDSDRLIHDFNLCQGCGLCSEVCTCGAMTVSQTQAAGGGLSKQPSRDESLCTHCGRCGSVCASGAISQEKFVELTAEIAESGCEHLVFFCRNLNMAKHPAPLHSAPLHPGLNIPLVSTRLSPQLSQVRLPEGTKLVNVRCTGRIGVRTLLSFILAGVKGVLIFACPPHACEYGEKICLSSLHVEGLKSFLKAYGMGGVRVDLVVDQPETPAQVEEMVRRFREGRVSLTAAQ